MMKTNTFADGVNFGNQALGGAFFRPNIIFLTMLEQESSIQDYPVIINEARNLEIGVALYMPHPKAMLGRKQTINVWVRNKGGVWDSNNVTPGENTPNLSLLMAYKLKKNWDAEIRLITIISPDENIQDAKEYLNEFMDLTRMPIKDFVIEVGNFYEELEDSPPADINLFGISPVMNISDYLKIAKTVNSSCMFIMDSGHENVFA